MSKEEEMAVFEMTSKAELIAQQALLQMDEAGVYRYPAILAILINCVFDGSREIGGHHQVEMLEILQTFIDQRLDTLKDAGVPAALSI